MTTMEKEAIIKLVFGIRGSGKTVKVRNLIKDNRRLLVVDTLCNDYFDGVAFHSLTELKRFWLKVYSSDFRLIYKPPGDESEIREDIAEICKLCDACENLTLVVEEINIIFDEKRPPTEFNNMIFSGRKSGIELIGVAQRPFGFGRKLTSQAKEFTSFTIGNLVTFGFLSKVWGPMLLWRFALLSNISILGGCTPMVSRNTKSAKTKCCKVCGKPISDRAMTCSKACRQKAYRRRKILAEISSCN